MYADIRTDSFDTSCASAEGGSQPYQDVVGGAPDDLNLPLRVKEARRESSDCRSIIFDKPCGFTYNAGDWMDLRFPCKALAIGRTYSFASSPTEPDLRITFTRGVSPFKRALEAVTPGDTLLVTQHGSNGFLLDRRLSALFIAGGVGITPFRSMIKAVIDSGGGVDMTLIYQSHTDDFPFRHELDAWAAAFPYFRVRYVTTGVEGRLTKDKLRMLLPDILATRPMCYVAGSPGMVDSIEDTLIALGIGKDAIKTDRFTGYA